MQSVLFEVSLLRTFHLTRSAVNPSAQTSRGVAGPSCQGPPATGTAAPPTVSPPAEIVTSDGGDRLPRVRVDPGGRAERLRQGAAGHGGRRHDDREQVPRPGRAGRDGHGDDGAV